jgi:hypothetical protein
MGTGACALAGLLASACGSSSTPATPSDGGSSTTSAAAFGALCSQSQDCQSLVCLRFTSNAQGASGICSALCSTGAQCGSAGTCVAVSNVDAGACFPVCSGGAQCGGGLPCIWDPSVDAGICQPLPGSFCKDIAAQGVCQQCLGALCCSALTACAEDVACSQLELSCAGKPACANALQASGNGAAKAVGSCAASSCAPDCQ